MNHGQNRLMWKAAAALLALSCGTAAAGDSSAVPDRPVPGLYEVITRTTYQDAPVADSTVTTMNCVTEADLEKDPSSVFAQLPEGRSCQVDDFVMADGVINMHVFCNTETGTMNMLVNGSYDENGYQMVSDVTVVIDDQEVKMQSTIEGKIVGDC